MSRFHFRVNDIEVEVSDIPPTTTLLRFLREKLNLTGTKEGCAEGDCGACTVVFLDPDASGGPRYRAINSCLVLLPMMKNRSVYTIEGLERNGSLHPAQQAVVDYNASQCGFCTPGVVMSMFEAAYRNDMTEEWKFDDQMCGNLCRCTGYRPIREALSKIAGTRPEDHFLEQLHGSETGLMASVVNKPSSPESGDNNCESRNGSDKSEKKESTGLNEIPEEKKTGSKSPVDSKNFPATDNPTSYITRWGSFYSPESFDELFRLLDNHSDARIVCGGTDIGLLVTKAHKSLPCLISLEFLPGMKRIEETKDFFVFGAALPLTDLEDAVCEKIPAISRMLRYFASRQIKHRGTIGGSLCNASPIGDLAPALLALDASCIIRNQSGIREISIDDFFLDYRKTAAGEKEILEYVKIPKPPKNALTASYKVSKRREMDISSVSASFFIVVEDGIITRTRLAYGGMAATPARAFGAEAALTQRAWNMESLEHSIRSLEYDFEPISDFRASAWYRREVAGNLLRAFYSETEGAK